MRHFRRDRNNSLNMSVTAIPFPLPPFSHPCPASSRSLKYRLLVIALFPFLRAWAYHGNSPKGVSLSRMESLPWECTYLSHTSQNLIPVFLCNLASICQFLFYNLEFGVSKGYFYYCEMSP